MQGWDAVVHSANSAMAGSAFVKPHGWVLALWWEHAYRGFVILTDLIIITVILWLGLVVTGGGEGGGALPPGSIASATGVVLVGSMIACRVWKSRILGQGTEELHRLVRAVALAMVALGLTALAFDAGDFRPWVFSVLPVTGLALAGSRYTLRRVPHAQRARDRFMRPVLVAGNADEVADFIDHTRRERHYGWTVTGVCLPAGTAAHDPPDAVRDVPVLGGLDAVPAVARRRGCPVVALTSDAHWDRHQLRELAWDLEDTPADLVAAPALTEVTGPRLHVSPICGLTLLHVSQPTFTGWRRVVKAVVDRVTAVIALVLLAPMLLAVALAIKIDDGGPVLFRQQRAGKAGALFWMINTVVGEMSLVGPRPPLPAEVERYGFDAWRRLLVKPGLTGLWQVSGRSDLSWEESIQLNLRYVENWSLTMDAVILWKTAAAVLGGRGAY